MALPPLTLQAQVKKHIQAILERLLHTVNRRLIVLDRENPLRVSACAAALGATREGWPCSGGLAACHRLCSSLAMLPAPSRMGWMPGMCPVGCRGKQEQGWSSRRAAGVGEVQEKQFWGQWRVWAALSGYQAAEPGEPSQFYMPKTCEEHAGHARREAGQSSTQGLGSSLGMW